MSSFACAQKQQSDEERGYNVMKVEKRNKTLEAVSFDKILNRNRILGQEMSFGRELFGVQYEFLTQKVIQQVYSGIPTSLIDELTAEQCASMCTIHPDYGILAARLVISNHHKMTYSTFSETMTELFFNYDENECQHPIISEEIYDIVQENKAFFDTLIDYNRDYALDYFGFKTLEKSYLLRKYINGIWERPQDMWLRVSIGIHKRDLNAVKETYELMSMKYFTHATPTLFNSGTPFPQLSSCFLVGIQEDSVEGIYNTLKDCAKISKHAGGIGLHIHNVRGENSIIRGTNGRSNGIVPLTRLFNDTSRFINQGGKRNGSIAVYLEPWHRDILDFLELKQNHGDENKRARDLFYAMWIPDLFMQRVKEDGIWTLFCPNHFTGLQDTFGLEFETLYTHYETETESSKYQTQFGLKETHLRPYTKVKARDLWYKILNSQMETGNPYLLYKDAVNRKSNQKNIDVIRSSNLCCEINLVSNKDEIAVCNLASLALPMFVNIQSKTFDYGFLYHVTKIVTANLNKVIDVNFYPCDKAARSNFLHRPIGLGVQGLADTFVLMGVPFQSEEAKEINLNIFETIYHAALEKSNELAVERTNLLSPLRTIFRKYQEDWDSDRWDVYYSSLLQCPHAPLKSLYPDFFENWVNYWPNHDLFQAMIPRLKEMSNAIQDKLCGSYSSFTGSPASMGVLQFDMWGQTDFVHSRGRFDWASLKEKIRQSGLRNSTLLAPMPTASTSQILGFNECFEPFTSNIYSRKTMAGEFVVVNKYLVKDLLDLGLWNEEMKNAVIAAKGSVQGIETIPQEMKEKYKIAWEMSMKKVIDLAVDRGMFVCQSQSMNLWIAEPTYASLTSMHFYAWEKGLKTGIYYLRRKANHQAQMFTIEPTVRGSAAAAAANGDVVSRQEEKICMTCSA